MWPRPHKIGDQLSEFREPHNFCTILPLAGPRGVKWAGPNSPAAATLATGAATAAAAVTLVYASSEPGV